VYVVGNIGAPPTCSAAGHRLPHFEAEAVKVARATAQANACINNLRQLDGAKEQWALENKKTPDAVPTDDDLFGPVGYIKQKPTCPNHGVYTIGAINTPPACSIPAHVLP
jgi:hypothetical protein